MLLTNDLRSRRCGQVVRELGIEVNFVTNKFKILWLDI